MNRIHMALLASILSALITGCSTVPRFHEASHANAVLQFSSWDYTFLIQPRYDDHGFLLQVPRDNVSGVFHQVNLQDRDLAVVIVGWNRTPEEVRQLVTDWNSILRGNCGFRRVVVVKSSGSKQLNGSIILDDSSQPSFETASPARTRAGRDRAEAVFTPAPGANAANSPGASVPNLSQHDHAGG